jgi:D-alanyl-lipoteichoic acid acyltransferase DltB (MBOAT superfamily)
MWRGVLQLILYRLVYYQVTIDSVDVENLGDLAFYMLSTFLLYVRISGHFHLIVGMLHLFGFNLPETHHRYFLASSFTDFWRRINIYWKDFMLKVFYYPAYFRLRSLGETKALVLATTVVFIATWFLHLVQWFWIRGSVNP